jgi:hypothetical protein
MVALLNHLREATKEDNIGWTVARFAGHVHRAGSAVV